MRVSITLGLLTRILCQIWDSCSLHKDLYVALSQASSLACGLIGCHKRSTPNKSIYTLNLPSIEPVSKKPSSCVTRHAPWSQQTEEKSPSNHRVPNSRLTPSSAYIYHPTSSPTFYLPGTCLKELQLIGTKVTRGKREPSDFVAAASFYPNPKYPMTGTFLGQQINQFFCWWGSPPFSGITGDACDDCTTLCH